MARPYIVAALAGAVAVAIVFAAAVTLVLRTGHIVLAGGTVTLADSDPTTTKFTWNENPMSCWGVDSFADVAQGAPVTVTDVDGVILAVGTLGAGTPGGLEDTAVGTAASQCLFTIGAFEVPERDFYQVKVGNQQPVMADDVGALAIRLGS